ncbi:MAG: hypothetical protein K0B00_02245 [Rhodobacteraceae bacterium]|nr:hypothetical protein [Paracoccaceae bacterium]
MVITGFKAKIGSALALCAFAGAAGAGGITVADCDALNLPIQIDFEDFPRVVNGTNYDDLLRFPGASIGERFAGQALAEFRTFDLLDLNASAPLRLLAGAPGHNLSVEARGQRQNTLYGLGPMGFEHKSGSGEGAISILFTADQQAIGASFELEMVYAGSPPPGSVRIAFFGRDATLLGEVSFSGQGRTRACFQTEGAGIAGVSITNTDIQGISIDDIAFSHVLVLG